MKKEKQRKKRKTWKEIEKENEMEKKKRKIDEKKRGPNAVPLETAQKLIFYIGALIRNREAIEAKKDFEHPRKEEEKRKNKGQTMKENERK